MPHHKNLTRLPREFYRGHTSIHWIHSITKRKTGWLDDAFHGQFREALLHSLARYAMACPVYCLMPDHIHILISGVSKESDQLQFSKRLRLDLGKLLTTSPLQAQAYEHVLKESELETGVFQSIAQYIAENPVRKNLSDTSSAYSYSGTMIPGYFGLNPHEDGYWERYWKIYNRVVSN